jgi:MFS family permease
MRSEIRVKAGMPLKEKLMLAFLAAINFCLSLDKQALSAAAPLVQHEFNFSLVQMSVVISAMSWTYAIVQIPSGWLAEKFGPRTMLFGATICWSMVTLVTPFAAGFTSFLILRLMLGAGQAPDWSASVLAVSNQVPEHRRSTSTSIMLSAIYAGLVVGGPCAIWLIENHGWEACFYACGAAGVVLAAVCIFTPGLEKRPAIANAPGSTPPRVRYAKLLLSPQFWAIGLGYYTLSSVFGFYWGMLPVYLVAGREMPFSSIGWLISVPYIFLWGGTLLSGRISDAVLRRTGSVWHARVPLGALGMAASCLGMTLLLFAQSRFLMGCSISLSLLGIGMAQVATWSSVQDIGHRFSGQLAGWVGFCGHLSGSTMLVLIALLVKNYGGWHNAMLLPIIVAGIGAILWLFVKPQIPIGDGAEIPHPTGGSPLPQDSIALG